MVWGLLSSATTAAPAFAASWHLILPRILEELQLADAKALQMHLPRLEAPLKLVQHFTRKQRQSAIPTPLTGPTTPIVTQQALTRMITTKAVEDWTKASKLAPPDKA